MVFDVFSQEQIRYLDRLNRASQKQNIVYRNNLNKNYYETEKEKYAKQLEQQAGFAALTLSDPSVFQTVLPVSDVVHTTSIRQGRQLPLGKIVNAAEMSNVEARRLLKGMLEMQIQEKEQKLLSEAEHQRKYLPALRLTPQHSRSQPTLSHTPFGQ